MTQIKLCKLAFVLLILVIGYASNTNCTLKHLQTTVLHKRTFKQQQQKPLYQQSCDPQHQVSDIIGVGEVTRRHHLADPNWQVQAAQDPGEDLHTHTHTHSIRCFEFHLSFGPAAINTQVSKTCTHARTHSQWGGRVSSQRSRCCRWQGERTGWRGAARSTSHKQSEGRQASFGHKQRAGAARRPTESKDGSRADLHIGEK